MLFPKVHSFLVNFAEYIQCVDYLFGQIFYLSKLKYCKITYRTKDDYQPLPIHFTKYDCSPIEYLVINTRLSEPFDDLLSCLPRLRHLSINCLVNSNYIDMKKELRLVVVKHLKYVSTKIDCIRFNRFENFIKEYFSPVEVLRLTTTYDPNYLDVKQWEQLITSYMPNLCVFDVNFDGHAPDNKATFHTLINHFHSSFWIAKQWFFKHQHDWQESLKSGILYSTDPYRYKLINLVFLLSPLFSEEKIIYFIGNLINKFVHFFKEISIQLNMFVFILNES
jgi:hypothetical protein